MNQLISVLIGFVILLFVPESPYFLMSKYNDEKGARKSLSWFFYGNIEQVTILGDWCSFSLIPVWLCNFLAKKISAKTAIKC